MTVNGSEQSPLMAVRNLSVSFRSPAGRIHAVRDVSFTLNRGEILALVGESGCGKSTVAFALMGYFPDTAEKGGSVTFLGTDLLRASPAVLQKLRGNRIAMVYQDPAQSLSPNMQVGEQILEVLRQHKGLTGPAGKQRATHLFASVKLPEPERIGQRYPHQLSGGQQQRVVIAMALACDPDLLIMDEPTTGLDVTTAAAICDLILELKERVSAGIIYVTHNLGVVACIADRVLVMYAGEAVEEAPVRPLFGHPCHPYTAGLLECIPHYSKIAKERRISSIPGQVYPAETKHPGSCLFASRCPLAVDKCRESAPTPMDLCDDRWSRCFRAKDVNRGIWAQNVRRERLRTRQSDDVLLEAKGLQRFHGGWLRKYLFFGPPTLDVVRAVVDVNFQVGAGKTLGVVGESGSGKTTIARLIVGLLPPSAGQLTLQGTALAGRVEQRLLAQKAALQMVFQNPAGSLNPKLPVIHAVVRSLRRISGAEAQEASERATSLLNSIGLESSLLGRRPSELSGGQQQRVALAAAFAVKPEIIVADEAVSALDVSVQAQVLVLLDQLQQETGTSYVFISHDLAVVRYLADDILVMCAGHVAEYGPVDAVLEPPWHPYTEALLAAVPVPDPDAPGLNHVRLEGTVPNLREVFSGCFFAGRCPRKLNGICDNVPPPRQVDPDSTGHVVFCHIPLDELAVIQRSNGQTEFEIDGGSSRTGSSQ